MNSFLAAVLLAASITKLDSLDGLALQGVRADVVTYEGRRAVHLVEVQSPMPPTAVGDDPLAIVTGSDFENGTIEVDLAGLPQKGAVDTARGFVGIAFRLQAKPATYEYIYLRPTNGRADDQLRRNHSTQYASYPDYPWNRLRSESPGVYESYVDLEAGKWTHIRITVHSRQARLFVDGASQPCLIINDMKLPPHGGSVALWIGAHTEAYFANLRLTPEP